MALPRKSIIAGFAWFLQLVGLSTLLGWASGAAGLILVGVLLFYGVFSAEPAWQQAIFFVGVFVFAASVATAIWRGAAPFLKAWLPMPSSQGKAAEAVSAERIPTWYTKLLDHDKSEIGRLVRIHKTEVDWSHLQEDSSLMFIFSIFNGSILDLRWKGTIVGRFRCSAGENSFQFDSIPQVVQTSGYNNPLPHGGQRELTLRQPVSANQEYGVVWGGNDPVEFDFASVDIFFESRAPDGSAGSDVRLPLPGSYVAARPGEGT